MNESAPPVSAPAAAAAAAAPELIQKYGCVACHSIDQKLVGPAFRDVAGKYQGNAGAAQHLAQKIRNGGSGVWGTIPMPPQSGPSDVELATIVQWALTLPAKK